MKRQPFILRSILVSLLVLTGQALLSQKQEVDAVFMKNGSIYRGILQHAENPGIIVLETLCSNTLALPVDEIDRIGKEKIPAAGAGARRPDGENGYFNRTGLGVLAGSGPNAKNLIFSVQMVNGWQIRNRIYPGLGVALEFFEQAFLPVYSDMVFSWGKGSVSPFVRGSIGYSLPLEDPPAGWGTVIDHRGGVMYAGGVGTVVRINGNTALTLSLVYRFQSLKSVRTQEWNNDRITIETQYNRLAIRLGFLFD